MFLRATKRFKDGKDHFYWSLVENVRVGRRVFQRQALYLGELNDSQREEWQHAVEALDEKGNVRQLKLFPEDRAPETVDGQVVKIRMDRLVVRNMRNWGEVWLGTEIWDRLGLDGFWSSRLPPNRKGTDWLAIMKAIVMYRLTDPGSELDNALRHDYVTNFCDNACILLNYDCKDAPNTSNLVERYYADWDKRIDRAKCTRLVSRATPTLEQQYGVATEVLFVFEDVKAGTVLTRDMLAHRDYVSQGVSSRYIQVHDLKSVLGRKVAFDLKRGSILLKTDLLK